MRAKRVLYASDARRDISDIHEYLGREASAVVARRIVARIRQAVRNAREMPNAGAPRPDYREGCRFVTVSAYLIYYDFDGATLTVLRVLHHARDHDAIMGDD